MEPTIQRLTLKRFRSIPAERVELANPTIFVGRNGSGKSNLVSAFSFLADAMASPLQAVLEKAGGISAVRNRSAGKSYPPNLGLRVDFDIARGERYCDFYAFEIRALPNYGFSVVREQCRVFSEEGYCNWFDRKGTEIWMQVGRLQRADDSGALVLQPTIEPRSLALPLLGGDPDFARVVRALAGMRVYSIEPGKLREIQVSDEGLKLKPDGSNAASVLREIARRSKGDLERISEMLAAIVPDVKSVKVKKHGTSLALELTQEWGEGQRLRFEGSGMSDGTLRAIGLLAAVYQQEAPTLIAIEEPEVTIHPGALDAILDILQHASRHMQVVITTHSPDLLEAKWIEDRHLRIVEWENGATRVAPVSVATRKALRSHLMGAGELLRSNALEPAPLDELEDIGQLSLFEEFP